MRCAVLGDPVAHSLSPVLHRAGYAALGLEAWTYEATRVASGGLPGFLADLDRHDSGAGHDGWRGLSLTMPLKREAVPLVASMSHRAARAGAVNTLVRTSYGWAGDNTDLPGAANAVRERYTKPVKRAVILGAGATAASVGLALIELGADEVTLLARDAERAAPTAAVLAEAGADVLVQPLELRMRTDVVVSTLPAVAQTESLVRRWADVAEAGVVFDVVYDPWPTPLVSAARAVRAAQGEDAPGAVVTGLDLLVHQAVLQFELFTGRPAPLEAMRRAGEAAVAGTAR